jgi:integrase
VATGANPVAEVSGEGFAQVVARYLDRKRSSLKPSSLGEVERHLTNHFSSLASLRLAQVDRRRVAEVLGQIEVGSGPVARNRARSTLSAFFSWCIAEGLIEANSVTGTAKAAENASRERVLSAEEVRRLWQALPSINPGFADIIRLLLLTGCRRAEIGLLRWAEVDLVRKLIVLPPERTKNSRQHELPLSTQALAILARQPRRSSEFLFCDRGFQDWDRAKLMLDARLHLAPWRLHDLRRTVATHLGELGTQPHHIEAILNHYSGHRSGVAGVYQRAKYEPEMRTALQRLADWLDQITLTQQ